MEIEEVKALARVLRERTGEGMYFCVRVLYKTDFDIDRAEAWFKLYYFDSHCFIRKRKDNE